MWSLFFGRESTQKNKSFWRVWWKSALCCSLSFFGFIFDTRELLKNSLSREEEEEEKSIILFSTRASFFCVCPTEKREKKKCSPPRKHDPPWSVPPLPFDRRDLLPKFDRRRLESERWKVRVIFFLLSFFCLFFLKMCVGFWRERARGPRCSERVNMIVDRRDASTIDRDRDRDRDDGDVSLSVLSISIFTDLYFYLWWWEREKKRFWERDGASFLP